MQLSTLYRGVAEDGACAALSCLSSTRRNDEEKSPPQEIVLGDPKHRPLDKCRLTDLPGSVNNKKLPGYYLAKHSKNHRRFRDKRYELSNFLVLYIFFAGTEG